MDTYETLAVSSTTPTELPRSEPRPDESASRHAARFLREGIVRGWLQPNLRIQQEAIATHLGISRIPVRDALRQLESEGLVRLLPNRSARVAAFDLRELIEVYEMRETIEPLAIRRSAPLLSSGDIADIERLHVQIADAWDDGEHVLDLDRQFHLTTIRAAGMPRLLRLIEDFWNSTQHFRRVYRDRFGARDRQAILAEHLLIAEMVARRDSEGAATLLAQHIRRTRRRLETQI